MKSLWYGKVGDEPDRRKYKERVCGCTTCIHFRNDTAQRHMIPCDLCKRQPSKIWSYICVTFVPQILKSFLGVNNICSGCRNAISCYMQKWGTCWSQSSDDHIKWALLSYLLEHYYDSHWYCLKYKKDKECCKSGHHPKERLAA